MGEDKSSCARDCGECSGNVGNYMEYSKTDIGCELVLKSGVQTEKILAYTKEASYFTVSSKLIMDKPFNIDEDSFEVALQLDDYQDDEIELPFEINKVQILDSETLIAEANTQLKLMQIGVEETLTLDNLYTMTDIQEERDITLKVYYTYNRLKEEGPEPVRDSFDKQFSEEMIFLNPR
jgi:hypothetical protein